MKNQKLMIKVSNALAGLEAAWCSERNFRIQVVAGAVVLGLFLLLQPAAIWWALIILCIALVLAAELANSAIEALTDHLHAARHPAIGKVKDMLAGMVLVLSIASVMIGVLALWSCRTG